MALDVFTLLSTIRDNASADYIARVPEVTRTNLTQVGNAIINNENIMNEFIDSLVNRIALTHVMNKMYKNPLARFKQKGMFPYGKDIQEIYVNPSTDIGYSKDGTNLLTQTTPDTKTCYYCLNRQSSYPVSIYEDTLRQAFVSEQEFTSFYQGIVNSLYSGDNMDEFDLCKNLIGGTIDKGAMKTIEVDHTAPKDVMKAIAICDKNFTFPSTAYNGYNLVNSESLTETNKLKTFSNSNELALIIRSDMQTEINYEVLANMFNKDLAEIEAMTVIVDDLPSEKYDVYAVLCDASALQVRDSVYKITSQFVANGLYWNFFLHHWEYLYFSMFSNAVAFVEPKTTT